LRDEVGTLVENLGVVEEKVRELEGFVLKPEEVRDVATNYFCIEDLLELVGNVREERNLDRRDLRKSLSYVIESSVTGFGSLRPGVEGDEVRSSRDDVIEAILRLRTRGEIYSLDELPAATLAYAGRKAKRLEEKRWEGKADIPYDVNGLHRFFEFSPSQKTSSKHRDALTELVVGVLPAAAEELSQEQGKRIKFQRRTYKGQELMPYLQTQAVQEFLERARS